MCTGFTEPDALGVARRIELQTVAANEAVITQGLLEPIYIFCSSALRLY